MKLLELYVSVIDQQRFTIIANGDEGGEAEASSVLPFWEGDQDWRRTAIRSVETHAPFDPKLFNATGEQDWMIAAGLLYPDKTGFHPDRLKRVGQALYQALFPSGTAVERALSRVWQQAQQEEMELHLRLKLAPTSTQTSRLADYPWELLHDGQCFLLHREVCLSRYLAYEAVPPRIPVTDQIRVWLLSVNATDKPLPDHEKQAIQAGLLKAQEAGHVVLTILPNGQFKTLRNALTDCSVAQLPQVIHFDGHGLYGQRCLNPDCLTLHDSTRWTHCPACKQPLPEPEGFLILADERGAAVPVSAQDFAAILPREVRLVLLSACQSGMAVVSESLFNGAAQQLIDHRIPAVVAMQYAVTVAAASEFSERFYQILGQRKAIALAAAEGRKAMGLTQNEWYRPVLYLRWKDNEGGQLFTPQVLPSFMPQVLPPAQPSMGRFRRLEIDRRETELKDLEADYDSVKAQLRIELDGPTRNRLNLSLRQIGQEMDDCEQHLQELRQGDS